MRQWSGAQVSPGMGLLPLSEKNGNWRPYFNWMNQLSPNLIQT